MLSRHVYASRHVATDATLIRAIILRLVTLMPTHIRHMPLYAASAATLLVTC